MNGDQDRLGWDRPPAPFCPGRPITSRQLDCQSPPSAKGGDSHVTQASCPPPASRSSVSSSGKWITTGMLCGTEEVTT